MGAGGRSSVDRQPPLVNLANGNCSDVWASVLRVGVVTTGGSWPSSQPSSVQPEPPLVDRQPPSEPPAAVSLGANRRCLLVNRRPLAAAKFAARIVLQPGMCLSTGGGGGSGAPPPKAKPAPHPTPKKQNPLGKNQILRAKNERPFLSTQTFFGPPPPPHPVGQTLSTTLSLLQRALSDRASGRTNTC